MPKTLATSGFDTRQITGQTLLWGGIAAVVLGGAVAGINGLRAADAKSKGESTENFGVYTQNETDFEAYSMTFR